LLAVSKSDGGKLAVIGGMAAIKSPRAAYFVQLAP
jgi:hypothetical protein